jgi:hypothetical protein
MSVPPKRHSLSEALKLDSLHKELTALEGLLPYMTDDRKKRLESLITDVRQQIARAEKIRLHAMGDVA